MRSCGAKEKEREDDTVKGHAPSIVDVYKT